MRRLSLITFILLAAVTIGQTQVIPYYGETYEKETGKLRSKAWISAQGHFRMETTGETGKTNVTIFRADSTKAYLLDMEKKTWMAISLSQITGGTLSGIAALEVESRSVTREFRGQEDIEGLTCSHYYVKGASALKGGTTDYNDYDEWIYEPDQIWRQRTDEIRPGLYLVHRNIKTGAPPAHLFEIPKDFRGSELPLGGMLEMFTGKSKQENQQSAEDVGKSFEEVFKKINEATDSTKTKEQQMQDLLKLLNNTNKKK